VQVGSDLSARLGTGVRTSFLFEGTTNQKFERAMKRRQELLLRLNNPKPRVPVRREMVNHDPVIRLKQLLLRLLRFRKARLLKVEIEKNRLVAPNEPG
jgi:hypothetical protein